MAREGDLLAGVANGDESSFRQLYEEFATRIFRYALTLLRNRHLAEEVTQETMITVWKSACTYSGRSQPSTWILGIARNKAYSIMRDEKKGKRLPLNAAFTENPAPLIEQRQRVLAALHCLPADKREIVFLTFYENLHYKEIATLLQIPEGTVKSRMYHAKRKLAEALS